MARRLLRRCCCFDEDGSGANQRRCRRSLGDLVRCRVSNRDVVGNRELANTSPMLPLIHERRFLIYAKLRDHVRVVIRRGLGIFEVRATSAGSILLISRMTGVSKMTRLQWLEAHLFIATAGRGWFMPPKKVGDEHVNRRKCSFDVLVEHAGAPDHHDPKG